MTQTTLFLNDLHRYYVPVQAPAPEAARGYVSPSPASYISAAPIFVGGGMGGGSGRHVQVVASTPETIEQVRHHEQEDTNNSRGTVAAIIGGLGAIAFAGAAAFVGRNLLNAHKELTKATTFRDGQLLQLDATIQERLRPILDKHIENLESKAFWAKTFVALTVGALACAVAAFAGGMLSIPWLITAAIVGGVFVAASGAFAAVWYFTGDYSSLPPEMIEEIDQLRAEHL